MAKINSQLKFDTDNLPLKSASDPLLESVGRTGNKQGLVDSLRLCHVCVIKQDLSFPKCSRHSLSGTRTFLRSNCLSIKFVQNVPPCEHLPFYDTKSQSQMKPDTRSKTLVYSNVYVSLEVFFISKSLLITGASARYSTQYLMAVKKC